MSAVDMVNQNQIDSKQNQQMMDRPKSVAPPTQQQITAALIQQQNRVLAQQNIDKMNVNLEKQRHQLQLQHQLDLSKSQAKPPPQYEVPISDHKVSDFLRTNLESLEGKL